MLLESYRTFCSKLLDETHPLQNVGLKPASPIQSSRRLIALMSTPAPFAAKVALPLHVRCLDSHLWSIVHPAATIGWSPDKSQVVLGNKLSVDEVRVSGDERIPIRIVQAHFPSSFIELLIRGLTTCVLTQPLRPNVAVQLSPARIALLSRCLGAGTSPHDVAQALDADSSA